MRLLLVRSGDMVGAHSFAVLEANGLTFDQFDSLGDADEALAMSSYNGILLSRRLGDGCGVAWLARQRTKGMSLPTVIVTANEETDDKISALDAGADDYVSRTVNGRELLARIRAVLRRPQAIATTVLTVGDVRLDTTSRQVWVGNRSLAVPRRELDLLEHLMSRGGRVVPRALLESNLYGMSEDVAPNSIEVRISRVRRNLATAGAMIAIRTIRGIGYMIEAVDVAPVPEMPEMVLPPPEVLRV